MNGYALRGKCDLTRSVTYMYSLKTNTHCFLHIDNLCFAVCQPVDFHWMQRTVQIKRSFWQLFPKQMLLNDAQLIIDQNRVFSRWSLPGDENRDWTCFPTFISIMAEFNHFWHFWQRSCWSKGKPMGTDKQRRSNLLTSSGKMPKNKVSSIAGSWGCKWLRTGSWGIMDDFDLSVDQHIIAKVKINEVFKGSCSHKQRLKLYSILIYWYQSRLTIGVVAFCSYWLDT